jgi:hypothetical protein
LSTSTLGSTLSSKRFPNFTTGLWYCPASCRSAIWNEGGQDHKWGCSHSTDVLLSRVSLSSIKLMLWK